MGRVEGTNYYGNLYYFIMHMQVSGSKGLYRRLSTYQDPRSRGLYKSWAKACSKVLSQSNWRSSEHATINFIMGQTCMTGYGHASTRGPSHHRHTASAHLVY